RRGRRRIVFHPVLASALWKAGRFSRDQPDRRTADRDTPRICSARARSATLRPRPVPADESLSAEGHEMPKPPDLDAWPARFSGSPRPGGNTGTENLKTQRSLPGPWGFPSHVLGQNSLGRAEALATPRLLLGLGDVPNILVWPPGFWP